MTTISELISYQIAQTEADLQSADGLADYAAIKESAIDRAKAEFYINATAPDENTIADLVKFFLSDRAVLYLIDVAIDFYQSRTVLSHTRPSSETTRFYDRLASLRRKRDELLDRTAEALAVVSGIAFGIADDPADVAGLPQAQAQADERPKITKDPWQWARYLYGDLIEIAEGIEPKTIQVDRP